MPRSSETPVNPPNAVDDPSPADPGNGPSPIDRARRRLAAAQRRFEGSWPEAFIKQLKALDAFGWTTIFGAELLWSVLPLLILLSSLANDRIDDDLSRHIGLNSQGAHILRGLFRNSPAHDVVAILTGLLFTVAGTIAVVSSLEVLYERSFGQEHRGRRDFARIVVWLVVMLAVLVGQGVINSPVRTAVGPVVQVFVRFVLATAFFGWTMHFLLGGRVPWRVLIRPALLTALLWLALALFSSRYFSSVIITDSHEFGSIGAVFTLLTWFILVGFVFVVGAAYGGVWRQRGGLGAPDVDSRGDERQAGEGADGKPVMPLDPSR
jgi:membrane protein